MKRNTKTYELVSDLPIPYDPSGGIFFQNREIDAAEVTISIVTKPDAPEAITIWIASLSVLLLIVGLVTLRQAAPQVSAVALATAKSELAQPLYLTLMLLTGTCILISVGFPSIRSERTSKS